MKSLDVFAALKHGASDAELLAAIAASPGAAKEKDEDGSLPLHCAVENGASGAVVAALLQAYPKAAKEMGMGGMLPLQWAVYETGWIAATEVGTVKVGAKVVYEGREMVVSQVDSGGEFVDVTLKPAVNEEVTLALLHAYPEAAKEKDKRGMLPLHWAGSGASDAVVAALLQAYPEAIKEKTKDGNLPLHLAFMNGASEAVVLALLQAYPDAAKDKFKDEFGRWMMPLHWAFAEGASEAVVLALLQAYPDAAKEKDEDGNLPLHCAIDGQETDSIRADGVEGESKEVGAKVICRGRKMIVSQATGWRYLSHIAGWGYLNLKPAINEEVILALLRAYPEAAKEKHKDGNLPLHLAFMNGASEAVVLALLQACPKAAKEKHKDGNLPLHRAVSNGASEAVVAALLAADMPLRLDTGAPVDHAGSWPYAVASTDELVIAAVGRVLASKSDDLPGHGFGVHIHELVKVRDEQGRTALELSTAGPRKAIYLHLLFCGRYELVIGAPEHRSATSVVLRARDLGEKTDYGKVFDDADKDKSGMLEREELARTTASIGLDAELFLRAEENSIDRSSFVGICKQQLGDGQRSVVIKLMQEKEQWERERDARAKNQLDSRFVVQQLPGVPSDDEIAEAVLARGGGLGAIAQQYLPEGISLGTRAIIMDAADRNLHQIFLQERPDLNGVRAILQQVFEAVAHLHEKKLMHGDLKLLNVVRFGRDNRLRLIDLDAAAKIVPEGREGESYTGAKFSSGVLPPEMFHELKQGEAEALEIYWQGGSTELQAKVAPKLHRRSGASFVVNSFRTTAGEPVIDNLPYTLVEASAKIDVWSLGALAYMLLAGEPLVPSTRDDDCASGAAMRMLHAWGTQPGVVVERLEKVGDPAGRDLVSKLLQREPSARLSVKDALEHVFFRTGRDGGHVEPQKEVLEQLRRIEEEQARQGEEQRKQTELLVVIKKLSRENQAEIRHSCYVLLKGIFEASEVLTPTTFIVLLKKLPEPPTEKVKAKLLEISTAEDGSGVTVSGEHASVSFTAEGARFGLEGELKEEFEKYEDQFNTGLKWVQRFKDIGTKVAGGNIDGAFDTIKKGLDDLVTGKTMYLYLIDELTGEPVRAEGWPIEIKEPSDVVPKLLPVMQVGLRAMSVYNGAAGVARMCGYPVPKVPKAWAAGARESVALLKKKSSVDDYGVVQGVLDAEAKEKESGSLRGRSLREFSDFLKEHDPGLKAKKSGHFAGLRRIGNPEDGTALWTVLSDPAAINAAVKERSCQREAEELRSQGPVATETLPSAPAPAAAAAAGASSGGQQMAHAVVSTAGAVEVAAAAAAAAAAKAAVAAVAAELSELRNQEKEPQQQQQQRLDSLEKQLAELQVQLQQPKRSRFSLVSRKGPVTK